MSPNSHESSRLGQTSVMSYKAVTAGKGKPVSEASRKSSLYKVGKKNDKLPDEWQSQLDHHDNLDASHQSTQSGSTHQFLHNSLHGAYQNSYSNSYSLGYADKVSSQVRGTEPSRPNENSKLSEVKSMDTMKTDTLKSSEHYRSSDSKHAVLTEDELATFRTSFCTKHHQNKCPNSDSCEKSHCLTWQRRNPYEISYCPHLCPEIQFVKKSRKMVLYRRCTRGKNCNFAHSKEEELYHPLVYKTKQCSSYPKCSRYFCPFVHDPSEMRDVTKFKSFESLVKDKDEAADTSFEFDCLDTLNDPETYRDNSYDTLNPGDPSFAKHKEKAEKVHDQMTHFEGDLGEALKPSMDSSMWYDLPNLAMSYDESFKPLYEPYQPNDDNYQYQTYQEEQYYNANYPNLPTGTNSNSYSTPTTNYPNTSYNNLGASANNYPDASYMNYYNNYDDYSNYNQEYNNYEEYNNYDYERYNQIEDETGYGSNYNYNYYFGSDYLQYNTQDLDEQFGNLNVKKEQQDDYSLNDMLAKFINEIGDK